eukprot:SAG11_NODE_3369_length_2493_cov_2.073935_3_plen_64_part_00
MDCECVLVIPFGVDVRIRTVFLARASHITMPCTKKGVLLADGPFFTKTKFDVHTRYGSTRAQA